ncbi:MAG: YeeE/YedE family protein [Arenicella sp.]|nr:YeeE/YedE family protein [Arenicella sp.]
MIKLTALACGILFGLGLSVSGMTNTHKVLGFLDVFGDWDASLAFVMGSAVLVTAIGYRYVLRQPAPRLSTEFHLPTNAVIDRPLLYGAILFGLGWGMYGYCPGPAVASLAYLRLDSFVFVAAMIFGMLSSTWLKQHFLT